MSIFNDWIFEHPNYRSAHTHLCNAIDLLIEKKNPFLFTLLGPSGSGKTELLKDVMARYAQANSRGRSTSLMLSMPVAPAGDALPRKIIETLVGPLSIRVTGVEIRAMAARMLVQAEVRILVFDELNHLIEMRKGERAQTKENRRTADWFKELIDQHNISIVLAGLPHTVRFFADNEQFKRRAMRPVELLPYAWSIDCDREAFAQAVHAFVLHLQSEGWTIDVEPDLFVRACYLCSRGSVGGLHKLFSSVERSCRDRRELSALNFANAYETHFGMPGNFNPFESSDISNSQLNQTYLDGLIKNTLITSSRGARTS